MSQPAVIEVDELLAPISESAPVGDYLRWEDEYAELEEHRRADEDAGDEVWKRETKAADWPALLKAGVKLLKTRSKDLQIAAWVAEAAGHVHGAVGLRDGLRLVLGLQEAYWETLHPEAGDMELRASVYDFIDHEYVFPLLAKSIEVTHVPGAPEYAFTFLDYEQSRRTEMLANQRYEDEDKRAAALEGRLTGEQFDSAAQATERAFYADLATTHREIADAVEQINEGIRARWKGPDRPRLSKLETTIEALGKFLKQTLAKKPDDSPPPEPEPAAEVEVEVEDDGWAASSETEEEEPSEPAPSRRPAPRRRAAGAPTTAEDAHDQIAEAAHFLRGQDPDDPTPYLVLRALAVAPLFRPDGLDPSNLQAPASELRERLFTGSREEDWTDVMDEAERALGRPEGRAWLDLHRYSALALAASGRDDVRRACAALLRAFLEDRAAWPDAQFRDGTPCLSPATRAWLDEEGLVGGAAEAPAVEPPRFAPPAPEPPAAEAGGDEAAGGRPPDPWEIAQEHARRGEAVEALGVVARAVRQAVGGRERFLRELQQAELCLALGRDALALPVLENLAARIDERKLEQWEDPGLCARVFSALYRCLRTRDQDGAAAVHRRLCQLDLGLAMQLDAD